MASWQSRVLRCLLRYQVAPKFRRAGISVAALRRAMDDMASFARVPDEARIEPVDAGGIPAEWVVMPTTRADRVVYYLHGGGGIMGSPWTHRELAARLGAAAEASVLVPAYRLAPEHPYPAGLRDALAGYRWLLDRGIPAGAIVIGGDSAGGALTLQTLLALRDADEPLPAAVVLLSPLTDFVHFDGASYRTRERLDPWLSEPLCRLAGAYYIGAGDRHDPYLCPVRAELDRLPPMLIQVGDHEVLLDDATRLANRARRHGVEVVLAVFPELWHVFQGSAHSLPEAREAIAAIGTFLRPHWAST